MHAFDRYYPFTGIEIVRFAAEGRRGVQWTISPSFKAKDGVTFFLEASESPKFDELIFSKNVGDTYIASDDTNIQQSWIYLPIYRVKLVTGDGSTYYSPSLIYFAQKESRHQYLIAGDIQRRELLRMKFTGNTGWLLKRKTFSIYKSENTDPISGLPISENNLTDAGTMWANGYYKPLAIIYGREGSDRSVRQQPEGQGIQEAENMVARMIGCPLVTEKDILVTRYDSRYIVNKVESKQYMGSNITLLQNLHCALLPATDPIYNWPINE